MLIECPQCNAALELARARASQRFARVRCAACDHSWIARLPPCDEPVSPFGAVPIDVHRFNVSLPEAEAVRQFSKLGEGVVFQRALPPRVIHSGHKAPGKRSSVAAAATGILCLLLPVLAIAGKNSIVRGIPATAGLYSRVGLAVNERGLQLRDVSSYLSEDGAQRVLMVEGQIANIRSQTTRIPDVRLSVRADAGREVYHWVSPPPKGELAAGESVLFRARLVAAPEDARDLKVQFVDNSAASGNPK